MKVYQFSRFRNDESDEGNASHFADLASAAADRNSGIINGISIVFLDESKGGHKFRMFLMLEDGRCITLTGNSRYIEAKVREYDRGASDCDKYDRVREVDSPTDYISRYLDKVSEGGVPVLQKVALAYEVARLLGHAGEEALDGPKIQVSAWSPDTVAVAGHTVVNDELIGEGW